MNRNFRGLFLLAGLAALLAQLGPLGVARAQAPGPADFDIKLMPARKILRQGEEVSVESTIAVRRAGVSGWSYGVDHDEALLDLLSATIEGTGVPGLLDGGFEAAEIIEETVGSATVRKGWIQAVVLSFQKKVELPITSRFVMARASYKVKNGICAQKKDIPSSIVYTDQLAVPPQTRTEVVLTIGTESVTPAVQEPAELTLECPANDLNLKLLALAASTQLPADGTSSMNVRILLQNNSPATSGTVDVQGWSYGLRLDPALLSVVDLTWGSDAAALNQKAGPDFKAYNFNPLERNTDGTQQGVTVGVVISLDPPDQVLSVPIAATRELEVLRLKSAITIPPGQGPQSTQLSFVSQVLGGTEPIENIITVGGDSVSPGSDSPAFTVQLVAPGVEPQFRRGRLNGDARLDIADGILIIRVLFYQDGQLVCRDAADVNDDGRLDIADSLYLFNYLLRSGPAPQGGTGCSRDVTPDSPKVGGDLGCLQPAAACS